MWGRRRGLCTAYTVFTQGLRDDRHYSFVSTKQNSMVQVFKLCFNCSSDILRLGWLAVAAIVYKLENYWSSPSIRTVASYAARTLVIYFLFYLIEIVHVNDHITQDCSQELFLSAQTLIPFGPRGDSIAHGFWWWGEIGLLRWHGGNTDFHTDRIHLAWGSNTAILLRDKSAFTTFPQWLWNGKYRMQIDYAWL